MERIIIVANQKGGVGKTSTVVNLAAGLAQLGHRVAVIDLDSQGALTISLGLDPYTVRPSTYNLLLDDKIAFTDVLKDTGKNIALAPANAELIAAEYKLYTQSERTARLRNILQLPREPFDFILIDTAPNLGLVTVNGLAAAHELLIPVAANYLSMRGVRSLLDSVWLIREKLNPQLKLLGVLPTLVHPKATHAKSAIYEMKTVFKQKVFHAFIPYDDVAATAPAMRKSVLEYAPNSAVATAYLYLAKEVSYAK
ncbi:MAG: AAA family ATPase [Chloroflexi bacterium]|jgi:chromosome partitioning protein|nr:AAA family ATPase [Chloroflexota bacterium]